jgi:hypothetical protein
MKKILMALFLMVITTIVMAEVAATAVVAEPAVATNWMLVIVGVLLAISEALALIPSLKSNSVFTLIWNILKTLAGKK